MAMDRGMVKPSPFPLIWDLAPRPPKQGARLGANRPGRWTQMFMMFGFAILSGSLTPALRYARGEAHPRPGESDIGNTLTQATILLVVLAYFLRRRRVLLVHARALAPYGAILALCFLSTLWSQYPLLTLRRCITLATCVLFGIYCAEEAGLDGCIRVYGRTALLLMLLSIVAFVAVPRVGHEQAAGYFAAMRGVFAQKNPLGECALLGITSICYGCLGEKPRIVAAAPAVMFLLVCIVLAKSASSLGIALLIVIGFSAFYAARFRIGPLVIYGLFAGVVALTFVLVADPNLLFKLLQRDATLTGRVPLWQMTLHAAMQRRWTGYGYAGFWNANSRYVQYIWQSIMWEAPSAHNGYIDVLLQIGIPGLLIYLWMWASVVFFAVKALRRDKAPEAAWILMFMVVNVLLNLDEGPLPYPDQFTAMLPPTLIFLHNWRLANRSSEPVRPPGMRYPVRRPELGRLDQISG
jgi:O-antigen ligase